MRATGNRTKDSCGFSLVEVLISIVILSGGLLALATGLSTGMVIMSTSHYHQIAKEKASEAMESVFTARDARKISNWDLIQNQGSGGGIFLDGFRPLRAQGPDGLINTADDGALETYVQAGADNVLGTADDEIVPLTNFTRRIEITRLDTNLRQIRVTVRYTVGSLTRQYQIVACISPFA
jgi:prepilin-type N-terminal cleavage/methylation domain-containing protein